MAKTIVHGYVELLNGEFVRFAKTKDSFLGTYANKCGDIVKCKLTIEYEYPKEPVKEQP